MSETIVRYDPMTGERIEIPAERVVRYDPMTGERIEVPVEHAVRYDPMTGERIAVVTDGTRTEGTVEPAAVENASEDWGEETVTVSEPVVNTETAAAQAASAAAQTAAQTVAAETIQAARQIPSEHKEHEKKAKVRKVKEKKPWGFFRKAVSAVALAAIFGGVAGGTFYGICSMTGVLDRTSVQEEIGAIQGASQGETPLKQLDVTEEEPIKLANSANVQVVTTDISGVVEEVIPAMVTILNTGKEREYDFWGMTYTPQSSGSGIIIGQNDEEILIATNHHVASSAAKLEITFIDGSTAEAKVKGMDSEMDLAVLAVSLEDLSEETRGAIAIAQLGDSDDLKLGQPAIVIGNALGIGISVTDGIISGLDREMTTEDGNTGTFIQTNAAVNHGNSGGALLNVKGEVIGIVSNKIDGESVEGMGYAIPISAANPIISELMERQTRKEKVAEEEMGYLGVSLQNFDEGARAYYNIPEGAFVYSVAEDSGAQKAGIYRGDVITRVENEKVSSASDIREILQYYKKGDVVKVTVQRLEAGEYVTHDFEVTLGASF